MQNLLRGAKNNEKDFSRLNSDGKRQKPRRRDTDTNNPNSEEWYSKTQQRSLNSSQQFQPNFNQMHSSNRNTASNGMNDSNIRPYNPSSTSKPFDQSAKYNENAHFDQQYNIPFQGRPNQDESYEALNRSTNSQYHNPQEKNHRSNYHQGDRNEYQQESREQSPDISLDNIEYGETKPYISMQELMKKSQQKKVTQSSDQGIQTFSLIQRS